MSSNETEVETSETVERINVKTEDFLNSLRDRVSAHDARLILDSAMAGSGLQVKDSENLTKEDAKSLCLELIRRGGPAFQVGTAIYKENQLH